MNTVVIAMTIGKIIYKASPNAAPIMKPPTSKNSNSKRRAANKTTHGRFTSTVWPVANRHIRKAIPVISATIQTGRSITTHARPSTSSMRFKEKFNRGTSEASASMRIATPCQARVNAADHTMALFGQECTAGRSFFSGMRQRPCTGPRSGTSRPSRFLR